MKPCKKCGKEFVRTIVVKGKRKYFENRKNCFKCYPYQKYGVKECKQCGKEFRAYGLIEGTSIKRNLGYRKICSECLPVRKLGEKTCKKCGKKFKCYMEIDGKIKAFHSRRYCLECSPFGNHNNFRKMNPIDRRVPRECKKCGRNYLYDKIKGHRLNVCNSCRTSEKIRNKKRKAVEYKGGKCIICEYNKCIRALKFHHLGNKEFGIGAGLSRTWKSIKKELNKCILVCGNCHDEIHDGLIKAKNFKEK